MSLPDGQARSTPLLERATTTEVAAAILREMILDAELKGGEPLRQDLLARRLGISRTPLREALNRLATEGLVRMDPHRGAVVVRATAEELREIYEVRVLLEREAAYRAALRCSDEDLRELHAIIEQQRESIDPRAFAKSNTEFHERFCAIAGQRTLSEIITGLRNRSEVYIRLLAGMPTSLERAYDEHLAIVTALERRDQKAVVRTVSDHLASTVRTVAALIETTKGTDDGH
jgi:DNA-binding GntR family transcriptional regulator